MIKIIAEEIVSATGKKLSVMDNRKIIVKKIEINLPFIPCVGNHVIVNNEEFKVMEIVFEDGKDKVKVYLEYFSKCK